MAEQRGKVDCGREGQNGTVADWQSKGKDFDSRVADCFRAEQCGRTKGEIMTIEGQTFRAEQSGRVQVYGRARLTKGLVNPWGGVRLEEEEEEDEVPL